MMRTPRRRLRLARYKKTRRQVHQRFRQRIFERDRNIEIARDRLPRVVVLTGAGISAESGIKTFRAADGLWEDHKVEDVATPEGFALNPQRVQDFIISAVVSSTAASSAECRASGAGGTGSGAGRPFSAGNPEYR